MASIAVLLFALFASTVLAQVDWCQVKTQYCAGREHIACEPNSFPYDSGCTNVQLLPMNSTFKDLILKRHNEYRQQIASGSNSKFPTAKKMGVIEWDDTLQFVAEKHAIHCSFQHDQCRATPAYPKSGQNLYYMATAMQYANATNAVNEGLNAWFVEWQDARAGIVDNLLSSDSAAFHFTVMVNDNNNKVGCGLIQYNMYWSGYTFDAFQLTCNYQYTNMLSEPMYVRGTPCSQCTCSAQYPALCAGSAQAPTTTSSTTTTTMAPNACS